MLADISDQELAWIIAFLDEDARKSALGSGIHGWDELSPYAKIVDFLQSYGHWPPNDIQYIG